MLGVLPFVEDPDLSVSAARALAQHLPPCNGAYLLFGITFMLHQEVAAVLEEMVTDLF